MNKYIFLDIDGVLNTKRSWNTNYSLDLSKVRLLSKVVNNTNSKIVLTSTWKNGYDKEHPENSEPHIRKLLSVFRDNNIILVGTTPDLKGRSRDKEIERYLYFHPVDKYIILDDDESIFDSKKNLYLINYNIGLTEKDCKEIFKILK